MIVLAIAGLILAVVFVAVPALQRNQRNNSRTVDRNLIATAINGYVSNTGGKLPVDQATLSTLLDSQEASFLGNPTDGTINKNKIKALTKAGGAVSSDEIHYDPDANSATPAATDFKFDVNLTAGLSWAEDNNNTIFILGQITCEKDDLGGLTVAGQHLNPSPAVFKKGNKNQFSILYKPEGAANVFCQTYG